jgi:hypothetical protein
MDAELDRRINRVQRATRLRKADVMRLALARGLELVAAAIVGDPTTN